MTIRFNPGDVWTPKDRGFSMGIVQPPGQVIHMTGQVAWNAEETIVGKGDVEQQTRQCFKNVLAMLHPVGGGADDIVSITTYFVDRSHLPIIQRVRTEFLQNDALPVSTSVMVAGLGHKDFLVELTPIAVIPPERFIPPA